MTQIFKEDGQVVPVTLVEAGPCWVTQIRTKEKDGYEAVQLGYGFRKLKNIKKPQKGQLEKIANIKDQLPEKMGLRWLKEFRIKNNESKIKDLKVGDKITVEIFKEGDIVKVSGLSKAKGFQGVVKRHGFAGAPASHGTKHTLRAPGSIGSAFPERVWKGKKMAGRMGGERVTIRNLEIVKIDKENNLLAIKGAIPGRKGTLVEVRG